MSISEDLSDDKSRKSDDYEKLLSFSKNIRLDWLNKNQETIHRTDQFNTLMTFFPLLKSLFNKGLSEDPPEFFRTVVHTFQAQAAYNAVYSGSFPQSGLNHEQLRKPQASARQVASFSPILLPVVLWLHDIGRLEDKRRHNEKSAELISELNLLRPFNLTEPERLIIKKIVQYHLLIGTLYTGESTYTSFEALLKDEEMKPLLKDREQITIFLDGLTLFTMIDVWGYHINDISYAMIRNYLDIRDQLKPIFEDGVHDDRAVMRRLEAMSADHIDRRLMGYMMAFSKIGKKSYLTYDFYDKLIHDGFLQYAADRGLPDDWEMFKHLYLNKMNRIQFIYGLGVLIPLAYGGTGIKMHLTPETKVNPNLFHLLATINQKITEEEKSGVHCMPERSWHVVFKGYPPWNRAADFYQQIDQPGMIEKIIGNGEISMDRNNEINHFSIDYGML